MGSLVGQNKMQEQIFCTQKILSLAFGINEYNIFFDKYIYTQYIAEFIIYMVVLSRKRDIIKLIVEFIEWSRTMSVEYNRLFERMKTGKISGIELVKKAGVSGNVMTRIRRNEYVSLESIEKICNALGCKVDDIVEFKTQ